MTADEMLIDACKKGLIDKVKTLLAPRKFLMFNISPQSNVNAKIEDGLTPLHAAARNGYKDIVEFLIDKGAEMSAQADGFTPLHLAASNGHKDIMEFLVNKGADINIKTKDGGTPLHFAAYQGYKDIAEFLINKGADINVELHSFTPLQLATKNGHNDIAELLIAKSIIESDAFKNYSNKQCMTKEANAVLHEKNNKRLLKQNVQLRVFDTRSDQEKKNEQDGIAGKSIPSEAEELYRLLVEAHSWGRTNKWPHHSEYPQRKKIRDIGEQINSVSGFDGMQRTAYNINARNNDLTTHLNQLWDGIGRWTA